MRNKWIYDKVNALVKKYGTRDPETLINDLNVKLRYISETSTLLGMYRVILRNRYIFIPSNVGALEKTVLAHELGHDQLHREFSAQGVGFHESRIFNPTNTYETEANIFAAHLLISDQDVLSLIEEAGSDVELASELGVEINLLDLKISELVKMKMLNLDNAKIAKTESTFLKRYRPSDGNDG